ncbi:hypothetical protein AAF712_015366 [Marasmius tenuissimus]|uniref:Uncharacterized protein n=1 Tax=Marasmius tenuissimus TaxID=585030 RepID=A0ABR2ZBW5_9AGAR
MDDLAGHLKDGILKRVKKVVLVICSNTFEAVTSDLFPQKLRAQLCARGFWSQLILLACGNFWKMREPVEQVRRFLLDIGFEHAIGFAAANLQTVLTSAFLQHAMENFVIHGERRPLISILPDYSRTGSHTGIIWMSPYSDGLSDTPADTAEIVKSAPFFLELIWHHPLLSPFGDPNALRSQCIKCGVLSPWERVTCQIIKGTHQLTVYCKNCQDTVNIVRPDGLKKLTGGGDEAAYTKHSTGDWMVRKVIIDDLPSVE